MCLLRRAAVGLSPRPRPTTSAAGSAKITVKKNGYEFIKEARRVELDGQKFSIKSDGTPQGFTGNQFYTFLLTPLDEGE